MNGHRPALLQGQKMLHAVGKERQAALHEVQLGMESSDASFDGRRVSASTDSVFTGRRSGQLVH